MNSKPGDKLRSRLQRLKDTGMITTGNKLNKEPTGGLLHFFPGEEREEVTPRGTCLIRETAFPLDHRHGQVPLKEARACSPAALKLLMHSPPGEDIQPWQGLYLDLETTGLAGGTGTWAFLLGAGWVEDNQFRLRQYFLRRPSEEQAMLYHFTRSFEHFQTLITFNGKSFDLPLVHTRQVLTKVQPPLSPSTHIDLFHCARRLWKERLPSCSLQSLEQHLLQLTREGDIPGEEIPAVYFDYLRRGNTDRLKQIFEHNCLDILTMASLLGLMGKIQQEDYLDNALPQDCFTMGMLFDKAGQREKAERFLLQAYWDGSPTLQNKALRTLGIFYKQLGHWEQSAACWEHLIQEGKKDLTAYIELAKLYEHRLKDIPKALRITRLALEAALKRRQMGGCPTEVPEVRHRLQRLEKKIGR